MSALITGIVPNSPASKNGVKPEDILISINGNDILDVLDYRFFETVTNAVVRVESGGILRDISIKKGEYESLGLEFSGYLMDNQKSCKNKCIFCFIDQLPKGMRESLYFKDDDSRLSFLFGNYVTLTNLTPRDVERIIKMRISPVNISVHTTNPVLRVKMMGNPHSGESLNIMTRLADAGIKLNCQLVLCPGINDGDELRRTLSDLLTLGGSVLSVAAVPVGITKFREGLYPLRVFTRSEALDVINIIETFGDKQIRETGRRTVFPSDEFYLTAEKEVPDEGFYEDFPQIENGVGMISDIKAQFICGLENTPADDKFRNITVATGKLAAPVIDELFALAAKKFKNFSYKIKAVENKFFGENITVAGLITGRDLLNSLKDESLGQRLLIPEAMLRSEGDLFLDGISLDYVREALKTPVSAVSPERLFEAVFLY